MSDLIFVESGKGYFDDPVVVAENPVFTVVGGKKRKGGKSDA